MRCHPTGGPTSTLSIARSFSRVGRLPHYPSSPLATVVVDATIFVAWREGRNRHAWLLTRRRCRAARATNRPAAMRSARPILISSATGMPRTPPPPHCHDSPSDPPPDRCRDHQDGPGAWSEGGGGYFYFVFFICLAGGIWLLVRSRHINFSTTIITIVVVLNSYVH